MIIRPFWALLFCVICLTSAGAGDPFPAALDVTPIAEPAPIVQDGARKLYYEFLVTSFAPLPYVLESIEARSGATRKTFDAKALASMVRKLGVKQVEPGSERTVPSGGAVILFLELDLGKAAAPETIAHVLHVTDDKGKPHAIAFAPIAVSQEKPIVVGAPLRGEWIAGDSVHNGPDAAHRRAIMVDNGRAWISQRFAIDWVQYQTVGGRRTTWKGPEDKNESYFCWGKPIYSVSAGKVVEASDGLPENVPHSRKYAIALDFNNAAGNHAVIEIAPHRYVLYAHMQLGSVKVKTGDTVAMGQVLGLVGNTGSSAEPHLHMHIDDQPSFLGGNGVPYAFAHGKASGPIEANVSSPTAVYFGPIGPQKPFVDDYPAENALVTFD